ncbi:RcnB family protein [Acinetobacter guillouiae]|uniref:RcnB family protein n=1 Tax=Acinetobacter guillouiae TaxID=106649 RepID=UPI00125F9677|nr:RcnB family protein [Acinetobacter guillouiae]
MKNILTTLALSMSALIATSAMAAPHDYHRNDHNRWNNNNHYDNRVNSSQRWRSGQYFPTQFNSSRYHVNYKNYRQLPKPGRYQQWYKVNGDYVLVNERNNRIIRVIG